MYKGKWIYWVAQFGGWLAYATLIYLASSNADRENARFIPALMLIVTAGIALTHVYRQIVVAYNWFRYSIAKLIPRVIFASLMLGVVMLGIRIGIQEYILDEPIRDLDAAGFIIGTINQAFLIFLWSSIYFMYHWFEKSRQEEIKNLKWEASRNEMELNNLKAQLNPHFMFNSMNSIRALIDENPLRAKEAVTQLSAILRNTLLMGRRQEVSLREEMEVVKDYLSLESIRYEERLKVEMDIDQAVLDNSIPPLLLQTSVENAIKHGISKLKDGGTLRISIREQNEHVLLQVCNTGSIQPNDDSPGIGLANSRKRLQLMYGSEAALELFEKGGEVYTVVTIPKLKANESNSGG